MTFRPCDVPCPEMGPDARISFTWAAMCRIEEIYPEHWLRRVEDGLAAADTTTLRNVLSAALFGAEVDETVNTIPFLTLAERILEARGLTWYGKRWPKIKALRRANNMRGMLPDHWLFPVIDAYREQWPLALQEAIDLATIRANAEPAVAGAFDALAREVLDFITTEKKEGRLCSTAL